MEEGCRCFHPVWMVGQHRLLSRYTMCSYLCSTEVGIMSPILPGTFWETTRNHSLTPSRRQISRRLGIFPAFRQYQRQIYSRWQWKLRAYRHCEPLCPIRSSCFVKTFYYQPNVYEVPCVFNTKLDGVDAYATSDLLSPHPTKHDYWKIFGRVDDQLMHSTGEKVRLLFILDTLSSVIKHAISRQIPGLWVRSSIFASRPV